MAVRQTPLSYSVLINLPNLQIGVSVCRSTIIFSERATGFYCAGGTREFLAPVGFHHNILLAPWYEVPYLRHYNGIFSTSAVARGTNHADLQTSLVRPE